MRRLLLPCIAVPLLAALASGCAGTNRAGRADAGGVPPASGAAAARAHARAARGGEPVRPETLAAAAVPLPADSVEVLWRERLARDPGDAAALSRLSRLLYAQRRHAEAVTLLAPVRDGAVRLAPADRAAVLAGLSLHEAALGRDADARAALDALPGDAAPGVAAYLAVRGGSTDSALAATERALRAAPESAALRNNRGVALLRAGDAEAASREFERAIALDPARPGPYYNLAILERFYRLDATAAQRWFQQYWSRSHADPDSLYAELGRARPLPVAEGSAER